MAYYLSDKDIYESDSDSEYSSDLQQSDEVHSDSENLQSENDCLSDDDDNVATNDNGVDERDSDSESSRDLQQSDEEHSDSENLQSENDYLSDDDDYVATNDNGVDERDSDSESSRDLQQSDEEHSDSENLQSENDYLSDDDDNVANNDNRVDERDLQQSDEENSDNENLESESDDDDSNVVNNDNRANERDSDSKSSSDLQKSDEENISESESDYLSEDDDNVATNDNRVDERDSDNEDLQQSDNEHTDSESDYLSDDDVNVANNNNREKERKKIRVERDSDSEDLQQSDEENSDSENLESENSSNLNSDDDEKDQQESSSGFYWPQNRRKRCRYQDPVADMNRINQAKKKKRDYVNMPSNNRCLVTVPAIKCECRQGRCTQNVELIDLNVNVWGNEYDKVVNEMNSTIQQHALQENGGGRFSRYDIQKVEKVDNPCLWRKFRDAEVRLHQANGYVNQLMLFHGTTVADTVVKDGFDLNFAKNGGMFGPGIYFAVHSSKSNQYVFGMLGGNGCPEHQDKNCYVCVRKILLCRVALGRTKKMKNAKTLSQAPQGYNSVWGVPGNALKFPEYAIYDANQAYPEYLISYKIVR